MICPVRNTKPIATLEENYGSGAVHVVTSTVIYITIDVPVINGRHILPLIDINSLIQIV